MPKKYKILLSAYACEPYRGSEPGVGWRWALELVKLGNDVWVLTRSNNQDSIEEALSHFPLNLNLHFVYYDLPSYKRIKKLIGTHLYYELWQHQCLKIAKKVNADVNFDIVHHLTFGAFRNPSYLYKLNKPFVFGPVGGGEETPESLLKTLPYKQRFFELIRSVANNTAFKRRSVLNCLDASLVVLCKTADTKNIIPSKYHYKCDLKVEIGIDSVGQFDIQPVPLNSKKELNILYVGRLLHWKGIHLALKTVSMLLEHNLDVKFTIIGEGNFKDSLLKKVEKLCLEDHVQFVGHISKQKVEEYYLNADLFLFPSLHDSSGNVVLEAISFGLPTICLDTGGPACLLGSNSPTLINCTNNNEREIISDIVNLILKLHNDYTFYQQVLKWNRDRVQDLSWSKVVYDSYRTILAKTKSLV